ncbi:MAG: hypothetical protein KDA79_19920, partial [Planctomycetaceae bacterium]|nr:hypothetical protein [Planctomycetaceae bacterium]
MLRGVRVNNLRGIDLDLPTGQVIAITGRSGSGRSSLALGTLFAESQRRYIEAFSTKARRFLDRIERPDADQIDHLPPAIAVRNLPSGNAGSASTLASLTCLLDHIRLLYARAGEVFCPGCGARVRSDSAEQIAAAAEQLPDGQRYQVAFPVLLPADGVTVAPRTAAAGFGTPDSLPRVRAATREELLGEGFTRISLEEPVVLSAAAASATPLNPAGVRKAWVIVDRLVGGKSSPGRLTDSIEQALSAGEGTMALLLEPAEGTGNTAPTVAGNETVLLDGRQWEIWPWCRGMTCARCGYTCLQPEPNLFNFSSPAGACPKCEGTGSVRQMPAGRASQRKTSRGSTSARSGTRPTTPASAGQKASWQPCPACHGERLRPEARAIQIAGVNLPALCRQTASEVTDWLSSFSPEQPAGSRSDLQPVLQELTSRLNRLREAGLGYLPLSRSRAGLSTGETVRAGLVAALSSSMVNTLCVLEEPSAGLHPHDVPVVSRLIRQLQRAGNSVVMIEHHPQLIAEADYVVELGPGAGTNGGQVVAAGTLPQVLNLPETLTAASLANGKRSSSAAATPPAAPPQAGGPVSAGDVSPGRHWLKLRGART